MFYNNTNDLIHIDWTKEYWYCDEKNIDKIIKNEK